MAIFLISYDLTKKHERDYESLYALLKNWKAKIMLESAWVINSSMTALEIKDALKKSLHRDDLVVVTRVFGCPENYASYNAKTKLVFD